jgi:LPXTG-motif cell wall-anchored protein
MDSVMITRIIAGVLAVLVLGFLVQRRRKSVR